MNGIQEFWQRMELVLFGGAQRKGLIAPQVPPVDFVEGTPISIPSESIISSLTSIVNFRDLASATSKIRPGRVYRCACPYQSSCEDLALLLEELNISRLIDLRTNFEWNADKPSTVVASATIWKSSRDTIGGGVVLDLLQTSARGNVGIYRISLQEWSIYTRALVLQLPVQRAFPILLWLAIAKMLRWKPPVPQVRRRVIAEANRGGLYGMYVTILGAFQPEIACALRVLTEAVKLKEPVAIFCKLGKDRTGLLTMLILACCGASDHDIVADYMRSKHIPSLKQDLTIKKLEGFDAKVFSKAPAATLLAVLQHLRQAHGSICAYLETCGFSEDEQDELASLLREG